MSFTFYVNSLPVDVKMTFFKKTISWMLYDIIDSFDKNRDIVIIKQIIC